MVQGRIDKTIDKIRRGGLPAPTDDRPSIESGNGRRCSGCNENIEPIERLYFVHVHGVALLRFHDVCYNAWGDIHAVAAARQTGEPLRRSSPVSVLNVPRARLGRRAVANAEARCSAGDAARLDDSLQ